MKFPPTKIRSKIYLVIFFVMMSLLVIPALAQTPAPAEKKLPEGVVSFSVKTRSAMNKEVPFYLRVPKGYQKKEGQSCRIFFLCPHVNADGLYVMGNSSYWYAIADQRQWFILAPTFKQNKEQVLDRKESYYYPESFSGRAVLDALDLVAKHYSVDTQRIFMQGFSGGAQFVHRFALWAPDRVTAVAVNSSSWLDDPNPKCNQTAWLVSIGESDETYDHTLKFVDGLRQMGAAPLFRSYLGMIHEKSGNVERRLNTAFFQFYDDQTKDQLGKPRSTLSVDPHQQAMKGSAMPFVGDMQCWKFLANTEENREEIPEDSRVYLPSEGLAKIWGSKEVEEDQ